MACPFGSVNLKRVGAPCGLFWRMSVRALTVPNQHCRKIQALLTIAVDAFTV